MEDSSQNQTIYLVRHAEKASQPDHNPPLTAAGQIRADRLAELLADKSIAAIYASDFKRTQSTARPLAQKLGLHILSYDPHRHHQIIEKARKHHPGAVLIVGHSNTVPYTVNQFIGTSTYDELDESVYDQLYIVTIKQGKATARVETY